MSRPRIGIVISTTRQGCFGDKPALWIRDLAAARGDLEIELIDLRWGNRGLPAVLENALDYAYREFDRKPAAYVGHGGVGGARGRAVAADQQRTADGADAIRRAHRRGRLHRHADARQDLRRVHLVGARTEGRARGAGGPGSGGQRLTPSPAPAS